MVAQLSSFPLTASSSIFLHISKIVPRTFFSLCGTLMGNRGSLLKPLVNELVGDYGVNAFGL